MKGCGDVREIRDEDELLPKISQKDVYICQHKLSSKDAPFLALLISLA